MLFVISSIIIILNNYNRRKTTLSELQHYTNSDNDTEVPAWRDHIINNDEDEISNYPHLLTPPIYCDFSCAEFDIDDISDSNGTISHDQISDEVTVPPPPPNPPPACVPEITFIYASKTLK